MEGNFKMNTTLKNVNAKPKTKLHMFDVLVKPILLYVCDIWGLYLNKDSTKYINHAKK